MAGKGDRKRPLGPEFDKNYEQIFGVKCTLNHAHTEECSPKEKPSQSDQAIVSPE